METQIKTYFKRFKDFDTFCKAIRRVERRGGRIEYEKENFSREEYTMEYSFPDCDLFPDRIKYKKGKKLSLRDLEKGKRYINPNTGGVITFDYLNEGNFVVDKRGYISISSFFYEAVRI